MRSSPDLPRLELQPSWQSKSVDSTLIQIVKKLCFTSLISYSNARQTNFAHYWIYEYSCRYHFKYISAYNESGIFLNVYSSVYINIYKIKY